MSRSKSGPVKIALGGIAGLLLGQLVLWWLPVPYRADPFELAPQLPAVLSAIAPAELRHPSLKSGSDRAISDQLADGADVEWSAIEPLDDQLMPPPRSLESASTETAKHPIELLNAPRISVVELRKSMQNSFRRLEGTATRQPPRDDVIQAAGDAIADFGRCITFVNPQEPKAAAMAPDAVALLRKVARCDAVRPLLEDRWQRLLDQDASPGELHVNQVDSEKYPGVAIRGIVTKIESAGLMFEIAVQTGVKPESVPIVSRHDPRTISTWYEVGDEILVVGVLVREPNLYLMGYRGEHDVVVLGGFLAVAPW